MASFDVVSKVDWAEVKNALDQAEREIAQRFDFKGTETSVEQSEQNLVVRSGTEERARAAIDVLQQKLVRRKVSLKHLEVGKPEPGPKGSVKLVIEVKEGIDQDRARRIIQLIKQSKLKLQGSIQEQSVRVSGKKKDELQELMRLLRAEDLGIEISFTNFRD
jgi:cyclic-di-GMP-binding protein